MPRIEVFDHTGVNRQLVPIIKHAGKRVLKDQRKMDGLVHVSLVRQDKINKLNAQYRKTNRPTDVLSFEDQDLSVRKGFCFLGDVILAPAYVRKQARSLKRSIYKEVSLLTIHGILHLLGFDHQTKKEEQVMFKLQNRILTEIYRDS